MYVTVAFLCRLKGTSSDNRQQNGQRLYILTELRTRRIEVFFLDFRTPLPPTARTVLLDVELGADKSRRRQFFNRAALGRT